MEEATREAQQQQLTTASIAVLTAAVAALILLLFRFLFSSSSEENSKAEAAKASSAPSKQQQQQKGRKGGPVKHKSGAEKVAHAHHDLDLNTLKGHGDAVTGIAFSFDGRGLATACGDGAVRVFKLDDVTAKSFKFLRIGMPPGMMPTGVAFGEGAGQLLVSGTNPNGGCLCMFGPASGKDAAQAREQGKLPPPEVKWDKSAAHNGKAILTIDSAPATYGSGDGTVLAATCSEDGTDVHLWAVASGKSVGMVDSNQLKNTMAALSHDGRFLAVAAFTADVKIWELLYGKDGAVREVAKVMQLKGHKSAVTWLSFTWDNKGIVTASKDGTVRLWNIDVRYHVNEDPKCLRTFPIPPPPPTSAAAKRKLHTLDRIAVSPDGGVLAVAYGGTLQWLCMTSGNVLDTAEAAHEGDILCLSWSPKPHTTPQGPVSLLASASVDKKVKLWRQPATLSL